MTSWIRALYSPELHTTLGFYMGEATGCRSSRTLSFLTLLKQPIQCFNLIYFILIYFCPQAKVLLRGDGVKITNKEK